MANINDLIDNWDYESDEKIDNWEILEPNAAGIYQGDCDDYACTALYILSGCSLKNYWKNLITGKAKIHFVTVQGVGHAVAQYQNQYIDNIQNELCSRKDLETWSIPYKFKFKCPVIFIAFKMLIGKIKRSFR